MKNENKLITIEDSEIPDIRGDIEARMYDIPFGNSDHQNRNFVATDITPQRGYRHALLRLNNRLRSLDECYFSLKQEDLDIEMLQIDIEELEKKAEESDNNFEKRRHQIEVQKKELEIEQKQKSRTFTKKLVNDCLHEIASLYDEVRKHPEYSREEFEDSEHQYFQEKLTRDIKGIKGAKESLYKMTEDRKHLETYLRHGSHFRNMFQPFTSPDSVAPGDNNGLVETKEKQEELS